MSSRRRMPTSFVCSTNFTVPAYPLPLSESESPRRTMSWPWTIPKSNNAKNTDALANVACTQRILVQHAGSRPSSLSSLEDLPRGASIKIPTVPHRLLQRQTQCWSNHLCLIDCHAHSSSINCDDIFNTRPRHVLRGTL